MKSSKNVMTRFAARQGLLLVLVCVLALEATSIVQYIFSYKILSQESSGRAQGQLEATALHITGVMDQVETAVKNNVWSVQQQISNVDSLEAISRRLVQLNPVICGSTVALVNKNAAPYCWDEGGEIKAGTLATEEYDYKHQEWFEKPLECGKGYWSEPYFDEGGGDMLMTTYSVPVADKKGKAIAVLTADVSLDWLTELVGSVKVYPSAFNMVVSREGQIMVCPIETLVMRKTVQELALATDDSSSVANINKNLSSGEFGSSTIRYKGEVFYMFFGPVSRTSWSLSLFVPEEEIYGEIHKLGQLVLMLQILSVILIILIIRSTVKNSRKLRIVSENKNRIEGELKVARGIQMSMVPKIFPPYPERSDVDMFATIVPAKEVGGDLYDFYIRDNRLFFCIGDVSGKGVPASLVMAVTRSMFRTVSGHENSPQRILTTINDSMSDMNESNMFVTMFCGVLDLSTGHLRYCNAGHNAPVVVKPDGAKAFLDVLPNLPLGVMPGMAFTEQEIDMEIGGGLFLYTDGINEAENINHECFGDSRLMDAIQAGLSAHDQVEAVTGKVRDFVADAPQSDDITVLYIRFMNENATKKTERHLILHNDIQQIPQLAEFVEAVAEMAHLDVGMTMSLNLALEEAVSNVIMYAYPQGSDGLVDIEAVITEDRLKFIISDSGQPFDPTAAPEADITLDVEDRPIGGLGIFLVRNIMDEVHYERADGKNLFTMIKKLA